MEIVSQEEFLDTLNRIKNEHRELYGNKGSRFYIDMEKAKSIIKLVIKNEKLNKFLISGFLEKYVAFIYKNKEQILQVPETEAKGEGFYIRIPDESFERILSRIVIDDIHLSEEDVEDGCNTYKEFLKRKTLYGNISEKFLKEYALFVYNNRYQIRKLVSKDLNHVKMDSEGNYVLHDEDFIGKINCDGGHNSPLWICINISDEKNENKGKNVRDFLDTRINRIKEFSENLTDIIVKIEEEKVIKRKKKITVKVI